jgi:hypothetical protein
MATFILSYPDKAFVPHGISDQTASAPSGAAFAQWLRLCDEIHRHQGRILVIDPEAVGPVSPVYAALLGSPFLSPGKLPQPVFLRANHGEPQAEDAVQRAISDAGLQVRAAQHRWQGQVDLIPVGRNRFILTYGSGDHGSSLHAIEEIKELLPLGAQVMAIELSEGCPRGSAALTCITDPSNKSVVLVSRRALKSHTPESIGPFVGNNVEVSILSNEDASVFASECINVRGTLILPVGCSTILRGFLIRRGFQLAEVDVSLLVGPQGGGPRLLACELPGLVLSDEAPSYLLRRERLHILASEYPT